MKRAAYAGALILTIASVAAAQTPRPTVMFRHGSTINLFAGGASARSTTAVVGGAGVGWELSPRIAIEGTGQWLAWGSDTHAFAAALIAQAGMVRVGSVMPFLSGGVGLYHVDFGTGAPMPAFYARRMADRPIGAPPTFNDPTLIFGGGVNAVLNRHWAVRPDVQEIGVLRDGRAYYVTTVACHVVYSFEDHSTAPRARPAR